MEKDEVTTDAIVYAIDGLHAIENDVRSRMLDRIVEYDEREGWREDAACSMADWLSFRHGYARATADELVRVAHALRDLPRVRAAFTDGRLPWDKVVLVCSVADADSDALWAAEAEQLSLAALQRWVRSHRRMRREEAEGQLRQRYLRLRWDDDALKISGRLVGAEAVVVEQALERIAGDMPRREDGTFAPWEHRCADALVELAGSTSAEVDRATVVVHVDVRELNAINGKAALHDGPSVVSETARRLACDGKIRLSVDDVSGQPLKLGRTVRTVSPWLGQELRRRDGGCRFADCGRTRGLQMHHIHHWAQGGSTDADNLVSLCWYHHRLVHEGGWRIRKDAHEKLTFIRPDGRPLTDRPTPLRQDLKERIFGVAQRE